MDRFLAFVYVCTPYFAVGIFIVSLIVGHFDKKEAAAKELREQRRKEHEADCFRAGANIRLERFKRKFDQWKPSKIETALYAGAKRIDEMRAK